MRSIALRLLGPLEFVVDDQSLDLGGPRQRVVLSMLALNANRVTSVEQLIDAVWDTSPPSTARSQIQICISALRKLFGEAGRPDAIQTRPPGYLLHIAEESLDSEQFDSLVTGARAHVDAGRNVDAVASLRAALALWRGPALADISSDLVRRGAVLLEGRRLAALEEHLRVELALGRHREITGELQALVEEQPLREELYGLLILALYRSGRQAEALEVYRRARAVLVEEVGIEPGAKLQDMERAILNHDPTLDLPKAGGLDLPKVGDGASTSRKEPADPEPSTADYRITPRQLAASIGDFTGRESQIVEIKRVFSDEQDLATAPFAVRIVAISGKGGVGKSTLAVRAAQELSEKFPDGHLHAHLGMLNGDGRTAEVLARFLRALGVNGPAVPEDLQERIELYRSRLAGKRLLVVLDDVTSEDQVLSLLPGSPTCAVITTSRARLSGLSGAYSVHLDAFDTAKSLELLGKIIGMERVQAERSVAIKLVTLCDGLPLTLRIAGARLAARPHWRIRKLVQRLGNEARRLDEFAHRGMELRSNIGLTYRALDKRAQRLFRLFALIEAPDFPGWTAAALLDTGLNEAEDLLESLVDAQLLDTVTYPSARLHHYRFHDLIRVYARERLLDTESDAERNSTLARLLGAWLALSDDAHRKEYGGDYTILHGRAPRWRLRNGEPEEIIGNPMDWWESERTVLVAAIRQAAAAGMDELCWDLALTSVSLFEAKGYFDDWQETSQLACEVAERAGNRRGHAAMLYSLGALRMVQRRLTDAERYFTVAREMFDADGDEHGRALVVRNWAQVDRLRGNVEAMLAKYAEALQTMRAVGDRIGEAHILCSLAKFRIDEGEADVAEEMLNDALVICQEEHCLRVETQAQFRFAELYLGTDKIELARQILHRVLLIVRDNGDRIGEVYALYGLGTVRHREGRLDNAETALLHALALARGVGERWVEGQVLYSLAEIALAKGDSPAAGSLLSEAGRIFAELGSALWQAKILILMSDIHSTDGDVISARKQIEHAARLLSGVNSNESERWRSQIERRKTTLRADSSTEPSTTTRTSDCMDCLAKS